MQRTICIALALAAGVATAQEARPPDPLEPKAKVPPAEYRSALDGYRPFAEQELRDWRRANEEVGAGGGHAGHQPGQGPGKPTSKPQPGSPESTGHGGHHGDRK